MRDRKCSTARGYAAHLDCRPEWSESLTRSQTDARPGRPLRAEHDRGHGPRGPQPLGHRVPRPGLLACSRTLSSRGGCGSEARPFGSSQQGGLPVRAALPAVTRSRLARLPQRRDVPTHLSDRLDQVLLLARSRLNHVVVVNTARCRCRWRARAGPASANASILLAETLVIVIVTVCQEGRLRGLLGCTTSH